MAQEKVRFDRLDRDFRKIMAFIERDTRVTEICNFPNLKSTLSSILEQLSRCQHSLDAFLKVVWFRRLEKKFQPIFSGKKGHFFQVPIPQ